MGVKFDKQKTKHQLFHSSISLGTILICMLYIQTSKSWITIGKLWESFIILFILIGEISKLLLAKYYGLNENTIIFNHHHYHYQQKQQRKNQYIIKLKDYLKAIILQFLCIIFYAFICIILGAPVLHNYEQTFMLSLLLTLLTVSPTVFLLGTNGTLQIAFCEKNSDFLYKYEENCLELYKYNAFGGICGAWIGSIVVPLDWDREWQIYPIPNVIGALLGCGIANIIACSKILLNTYRTYLNNKKRM